MAVKRNELCSSYSPSQTARSVKKSASQPLQALSSISSSLATIPPAKDNINSPICIVDNGGWTVKYGIIQSNSYSAIAGGDATTRITPLATGTAAATTSPSNSSTAIQRMSSMYNATARPPHQLTLLSGDEITTHMKNLGQLAWNYAMERGMVCDGETQLRVWNRMLENVGVIPTPVAMTTTIGSGGGKSGFLATIAATATRRGRQPQQQQPAAASSSHAHRQPRRTTYSSQDCTFLLLEPPFVPSVISEGVDCILFRELGFGRVARLLGPCMAAIHYISFCQSITTTTTMFPLPNNGESCLPASSESSLWSNDNTNCCCVVDSGFSFTHVVPTHHAGEAIINAIRRLDLGGKVLTNLLKEYVTYRQWNMMDEYHIVNDVKEQLCFVSDQFEKEMTKARNTRKGLRWFDREYLLPDFVNTFLGTVRLPEPLQRQRELEEMEQMKLNVKRMDEDRRRREIVDEARELQEDKANEEIVEADKNGNRSTLLKELDAGEGTKAGGLKSTKQGKKKNRRSRKEGSSTAERTDEENGDDIIMDDTISDTDSDDETDQQRLHRLKTMRDAERKRRKQESLDRQALAMSVERFAVPEVLFRPSDIGLDYGGIVEAIVESITACPPTVRAAMYHNVLLVGGNAKIPGFRARVELELRKLAPTNYVVRVHLPEDPVSYAWEVSAVIFTAAIHCVTFYSDLILAMVILGCEAICTAGRLSR